MDWLGFNGTPPTVPSFAPSPPVINSSKPCSRLNAPEPSRSLTLIKRVVSEVFVDPVSLLYVPAATYPSSFPLSNVKDRSFESIVLTQPVDSGITFNANSKGRPLYTVAFIEISLAVAFSKMSSVSSCMLSIVSLYTILTSLPKTKGTSALQSIST